MLCYVDWRIVQYSMLPGVPAVPWVGAPMAMMSGVM